MELELLRGRVKDLEEALAGEKQTRAALEERLGRVMERKEMEEALRVSEEKYRLIYEYTGESIYTYDPGFTLISRGRDGGGGA
jgi:PAS domain-containing protein